MACLVPLVLRAAGTDASRQTPLQNESLAIAAAHEAARSDDDVGADAQLNRSAIGALAELPASVVLAQRATAVCACLWNENDRARAARVARRTIARLAAMSESTDADRAERLIWEATLEAQFLDDKKQALALLQVAEKLAPEDERITRMEAGLVAALMAFGK